MLRIQLVMHCSALPVGRIQCLVEEEREDGRKLHGEMRGKPLDIGDGAGPAQHGAEPRDEAPSRGRHAVRGDGARPAPISDREGPAQDRLDLGRQRGARMIADQEPTPPQQMGVMPTSA